MASLFLGRLMPDERQASVFKLHATQCGNCEVPGLLPEVTTCCTIGFMRLDNLVLPQTEHWTSIGSV